MTIFPGAIPLVCPLCEGRLHRRDGMMVCPAGHCFDIAREGYVNLLPPQHRTRGIDGDTAPMLRARRRFLDEGNYAPLLDLLVKQAADALGNLPPPFRERPVVLEGGCGEGYYVGGLAGRLRETPAPGVTCVGMDLSKAAVKMAAGRYRDVTFFVGDVNRRICLPESSVGLLLNVFSPRNPFEFARVVGPGGSALVVVPDGRHLASLRKSLDLLDIPADKERQVVERMAGGFRLTGRRELRYAMTLSPAAVNDLVTMSPNEWHRKRGTLLPEDAAPFATEASFVVLLLRRET